MTRRAVVTPAVAAVLIGGGVTAEQVARQYRRLAHSSIRWARQALAHHARTGRWGRDGRTAAQYLEDARAYRRASSL